MHDDTDYRTDDTDYRTELKQLLAQHYNQLVGLLHDAENADLDDIAAAILDALGALRRVFPQGEEL